MNFKGLANRFSFLVVGSVLTLCITHCSSEPTQSDDVLQPVTTEESAPVSPQPNVSPNYEKVMELLRTKGYEGIGLQFESDVVLDLLMKVFSDPKVANRQIRFVYTGLSLSYDANAKSLTIGGGTDPLPILSFIQKHVPLNR